MADNFSTNTLMGVVADLKLPASAILDRYFPATTTEETEELHFDIIDNKRRLTPFVSPIVAGKVVQTNGYAIKTFKPAYVKDKRPFDANRPLKRLMGEKIGGELSPEERLQALIVAELADMQRNWRRRLEWMAIQGLATGGITITGDTYGTAQLSFGRNAALSVAAKSGTARWGQSAQDPLADLTSWSLLVLKYGGVRGVDVIMDTDTFTQFVRDTNVKARLDQRWAGGVGINFGAAMGQGEGLTYMGTIDAFNIFVYAGFYVDETGTELPLWPAGVVAMTCPTDASAGIPGAEKSQVDMDAGLSGVQAFGAIRDEVAGFQAVPFFVKSWLNEDPAVRFMMAQSAPLVVPRRINASLACAGVL